VSLEEEAPEMPSDPTPLAPQAASEIARAYANLAFDLHNRIPALEAQQRAQGARIDEIHGIALASHGLYSKLALRVEDIALAVRAKRTFSSGMMRAVSPVAGGAGAANANGLGGVGGVAMAVNGPTSVPAPESLEIRTTSTKTGRHMIIDADELERLKSKWAEKDAEERGAKAALEQHRLDEAYRETLAESQRRRWGFYLLVAGAVCSVAAWAIGHFTLVPAAPAPPAGGPPVVQVR
jgi:hypothetical protein